MFFAESSLLFIVLLSSSYYVFFGSILTSQIEKSCTTYVWFLLVVSFCFEYYSKRVDNIKIQSSLGYLWNERKNIGNGIVIGTCLLPLSLLLHCVIIDPTTNNYLLPYFDASISTSLVILLFWILGIFPVFRIVPLLGRFILSLGIVSYSFAIWTKGTFQYKKFTKYYPN